MFAWTVIQITVILQEPCGVLLLVALLVFSLNYTELIYILSPRCGARWIFTSCQNRYLADIAGRFITMLHIRRLICCLAFYISSVYSVSITPPSQDPWYRQPDDIGGYSAGDVIRSRQVPPQLQSFLSLPVDVSVKSVTQYLFRTTDSLGEAVGSVATLIEPYNADPSKLLGYQAFYDSASVDCSPSYTLRANNKGLGYSLSNVNVSLDIPFVSHL